MSTITTDPTTTTSPSATTTDTTATTATATDTAAATATARAHPVRRATLVSGVAAAVITTAIAAVASAADVPFEIDGEAIPPAAFTQMTLLGAVLGGLIAAALNRYSARPRTWFVGIAVVLTALSCIPSIALPPDVATKVVLVATHLVAAVVIVPAIARQTRG